jgi:hypothetical protein
MQGKLKIKAVYVVVLAFLQWSLYFGVFRSGLLASKEPASFGFGKTATAADIAAVDFDVRPDGKGLPPAAVRQIGQGDIYC